MNEICERFRDEAALLGRGPEELREHAASCPDCSEFLSKLAAVESELAGLRSKDASDELVAKLLARPELNARPSVRWRVWAMAIASAAGIALALRVTVLHRGQEALERDADLQAVQAPAPAAEEGFSQSTDELRQRLERPAFVQGEEDKLVGKVDRTDRFQEQSELQKLEEKNAAISGGRFGDGILLDEKEIPAKRRELQPIYPQGAKDARVQGTVVLELTVDREGNVIDVRVVQSIPLLDPAAIHAVREWKYAPSDSDAPRVFRVPIPFALDEPKKDGDRSQVEGLSFQEAKGYWANTYLPGDPTRRALELRLRSESFPKPHDLARPIALPLDATSTGALSVFVQADRRGLTEKSRLLVQVGIRAAEHQARRRPPMNIGVVLDLPESITPEIASSVTALLESLESSRELGDRFRLIVTGAGEMLAPEAFKRGPLTVALQELYSRTPTGSVCDALALALEKVHAGDDPTMPLGTSLVVVVSGRDPGSDIETLSRMAQASALGGVSVSVVALTPGLDLDRLPLAGQGRQYGLDQASEAPGIVDRELSSSSRTVARAIRLRIQLAEGVHLVDVLGSEPLNARESDRVRAEERAVDLRLARNLGIEADRGKDEDGIQIVIPAFYAGDAHSILLDVVADGPGSIADVTARYKDLVRLENTVSRASLSLPRSDAAPGLLETSVENDYRQLRIAEALQTASEAMERGETGTASFALQTAKTSALDRDRAMLEEYLRFLPQLPADYLRDSLLYASTLKRRHSAS